MTALPWDAQAVRQAADTVLAEALYWFPVRHHSPAAARHLAAAIERRKPKVIFIEAPADAQALLPYIVDKKTRPPIAVYSSYRDDDNTLGLAGIASPAAEIPPRFSSWYPMTTYSPEYVALKTAARLGLEVVLMDLPHHALIEPANAAAGQAAEDTTTLNRYPEDQLYQRLAQEAGFRDWDEAWDSLFEFGEYSADLSRFRKELATFCAAARLGSDPARLAADGTLARERFMWRTITNTLKTRKIEAAEAMVVCGGFHLFLDRQDPQPPPGLPAGSTFNAVMPYSFFQISALSGYGAGNRAPRFYQVVWELGANPDPDEWLSRHVVDIIKQARREGEQVSSADAISIAQHARMLASLRGRAHAILDDIEDAVFSCCCKGDPAAEGRYLQRAIDQVNIGKKLGKVTPDAPRLPLVEDFFHQLSVLGLQDTVEQESRITVKLDKRQDTQRHQSVFLHRLRYLQIPFCRLVEGSTDKLASGTLFKEVWHIKWSPEVEPALIENNLYGDTLEAAVFSRLKDRLAGVSKLAGPTCRQLRQAVDMELPAMVEKLELACEQAIAQDERYVSLSTALHELQMLQRHAIYQHQAHEVIDKLIESAFDRACFALPNSANAPEEEQQEVIDALRIVSEALLGTEQLDQALFIHQVQHAAAISEIPFLQGALLGMLAELRVISIEESSQALAGFAQQPAERQLAAGDFLDGMLATCRTSIMLGADHLVNAMQVLLRAVDEESFLIMLPRMRIAFKRLHAAQLDSIAGLVAGYLGLEESKQLTRLETSVKAAALFAQIDKKVAAIMQEWEL